MGGRDYEKKINTGNYGDGNDIKCNTSICTNSTK